MSSPSGYNRLSVITHWLASISVIALFFTHEGPRDSLAFQFHVAGGAVIGLFLIWRTFHRVARGFPEKPQQHVLLNLLSTIVLWGLILAVIVLVITGFLLPWTIGRPIDFGRHTSRLWNPGIALDRRDGREQRPDRFAVGDRIDAQVVSDVVEPCQIIRIRQAAIRTHQTQRFIFHG